MKMGADVMNEEGKAIGSVFDVAPLADVQVAQLILNVDQNDVGSATVEGYDLNLLPLPYELGN